MDSDSIVGNNPSSRKRERSESLLAATNQRLPPTKQRIADIDDVGPGQNSPSQASSDPASTPPKQGTTDNSEDQWHSTEESRQARRKKKKQIKKAAVQPYFSIDLRGFKGKVSVKELRDLLLWILADGTNPRWTLCQHRQRMRPVVIVNIPGLTFSHFVNGSNKKSIAPDTPLFFPTALDSSSAYPIFVPANANPRVINENQLNPVWKTVSKVFKYLISVKGPGDKQRVHSSVQTMLQVPLSLAQKTLKEKARLQRAMNFSLHLFPVQNYVLTLEELIANDYPVHSNLLRSQVLGDEIPVDAEDWKEPVIPPSKVKPGESRKLLAVDCEMCYTSAGLELTRVSVIDESLQTVYDTLVKPERDILDYNTRYSGITAIQMKNVTTTLQEVQEKLLDLIDEDTILMGHSLENDLRALKIKHPFIIDTALLYNSPSGPPAKPSLKHLASTFLKKTIQLNALQTSDNGTIHTHDSIEDARTVMELVKLKLERGPNFGVKESEYESIWEKIASGMVDEVHHDNSAGMNEREAEDKNSAKVGALIDYRSSCVKFGTGAKTVITCHNDQEIMDGLLDTLRNDKEDRVVWARFRDLEVHYGTDFHTAETSTTNQTATSTSGPTPNVAGITSSPAARPLPSVQERSKPQQELRPTDPDAMDLEEGEIGDDEDDQMECEDSAKEAEAKRREHLDLIRVLSSLDERIRTIWEELPKKAAFIIFSGNGDMRKVASLTAKKQEYQRLFCTQPISKIPLSKQWSEDDQSELQRAVDVAKNGVAMMVVKE